MTLLIVYVSLALGVSFLCSVLEAVLLSITPSYVAQQEGEKPKLGRRLRKFKSEVDKPLAAILSLNTIAHTVGAAGAGAQAASVFGQAYVGVISAVLTLLILLVSEIIPKTLGALYWRLLTPTVVRLLGPVTLSMWPLVKMAEGLTHLLKSKNAVTVVEREEILALARKGSEEGVFSENESRILKNLFRLRQVRAEDIMTPRIVVFSLEEDLTVEAVLEAHPEIRFSRIPIYKDNPDNVVGFVLRSDLLLCAAEERDQILLSDPSLKRPITMVLGNIRLTELFDQLISRQNHLAIVLDEYGGVEGLVTMEDLIETLIGLEIVDESDPVRDMRELARQKWVKRAERMGMDVDRDV
ncbi:MAG: CNNM domain-containing protein [Acidobacteriota bacterium]|nr:CNNM domain-containing protein [Acidobacteriota bacterium]